MPSSLPLILLFTLILQTSSTDTPTPPPSSIPIRYVSGAYLIPEAPSGLPIIYDSYNPLYYEFSLPKWDSASMKIQFWSNHNNCSESDKYSDGYPCPVMHHMNTLIDYFVGNMTSWKNLFLDDPSEETEDLPFMNADLDLPLLLTLNRSIILDTEYYCSKIAPHFATFQTSPKRLEEYYALIENCKDVIKIKVNLTQTSVNLESLYHSTFTSFVSDYWELLPELTKQESALNLWTSLESTLMLHQFMESQKWTTALQSCQQGQLPWTLVDHDMLSDAILNNFVDNATPSSEEHLAIPLREIPKYYKLPLTDCVFVGGDKLVVRILVPLRRSLTQKANGIDPYKLMRFQPIIFHEENKGFCWIDEVKDKNYLVNWRGSLFQSECTDEDKLCRSPHNHLSSQQSSDGCIQAIYDEQEEAIVANCGVKCQPVEKRHYAHRFLNFAHTVGDNFVYSAADEEEELKVECPGQQDKVFGRVLGAWNLSVPCHCRMKIERGILLNYEIGEPCNNASLGVEQIRPYHWRNLLDNQQQQDKLVVDKPLEAATTTTTANQQEMPFHYVLLWILIVLQGIIVGGLTYVVYHLRKWQKDEIFRETKLIYNVNDRDDIREEDGRF